MWETSCFCSEANRWCRLRCDRIPFRNFVIQSWTAASLWTLILNQHWIFSTCQTGRRFQAKHASQLLAGSEICSGNMRNIFCVPATGVSLKQMCAFVFNVHLLLKHKEVWRCSRVTGWNMQLMPAGWCVRTQKWLTHLSWSLSSAGVSRLPPQTELWHIWKL